MGGEGLLPPLPPLPLIYLHSCTRARASSSFSCAAAGTAAAGLFKREAPLLSGRCWRGGSEREGGRGRERAKGKRTSVDWSMKIKGQRDEDQGVGARRMLQVTTHDRASELNLRRFSALVNKYENR